MISVWITTGLCILHAWIMMDYACILNRYYMDCVSRIMYGLCIGYAWMVHGLNGLCMD